MSEEGVLVNALCVETENPFMKEPTPKPTDVKSLVIGNLNGAIRILFMRILYSLGVVG